MITISEIKNSSAIKTYIEKADESLKALGYTEHSYAHVNKVSQTAGNILRELGYSERECELAEIAGYLHDIGNVINRVDHAQSGAVMAFRLLDKMSASAEDIATIITAIAITPRIFLFFNIPIIIFVSFSSLPKYIRSTQCLKQIIHLQ